MSGSSTILVVEDETALRNILLDKLNQERFMVLTAKNGQEGLDIALSNHPDLILLDIELPVMDGITMLRKLREDPWGKDVEVIMLTNARDNKSVAESLELRSFDFLVKADWTLEDMVKIFHEKLDH